MLGKKVLIVEDEILIAREIEDLLIDLEYQVAGLAADAETALQKIAETQPDLVLVDIVIQGEEDGITLAAQVQSRFAIPIVYLTAYADEATLERAKNTRPYGYILKPFNKSDLRTTIEIALSRHQTELAEKSEIAFTSDARAIEHLSMLSHELRNSLSVIKLSATLLSHDRYQQEKVNHEQLLERIQSATSTMGHLIDEVLMLGKAQHDATLFNPAATDLVEFCQVLMEQAQWNVSQHHTLQFFSPPTALYAWVDSQLLWHLLNNLLSNAVKYSPQGGIVILRLFSTAEFLCFEVQDQGIGIPPEDLERLFQSFHRGGNVGRLPGTGLGLAIAQRSAALHGGHILVNSQVDQGTTFVVKLPLSPA